MDLWFIRPLVGDAFDVGEWEGVGLWKSRLFGPCEMALSRQASAIWGPKKSWFPGPNPLPLAQVMDLPTSKHYVQGRINQRSIGSFMYMSSHRWFYLVIKQYRRELPGRSVVNFSYQTPPPPPHISALNSVQYNKIKSQNLLKINMKL